MFHRSISLLALSVCLWGSAVANDIEDSPLLKRGYFEQWQEDPEEDSQKIDLKSLQSYSGLTQFSLHDVEDGIKLVDLKSLQLISSNLWGLVLSMTWIKDDYLPIVGEFKNLRRLDLSENCLTAQGLQSLKTLTFLNHLSLEHMSLDHHALTALLPLKNTLSAFSFSSNFLSQGTEIFVEFSNIKSLDVSGCELTDAALPHFLAMASLEKLDISHNNNFSLEALENFLQAAKAKGIDVTHQAWF